MNSLNFLGRKIRNSIMSKAGKIQIKFDEEKYTLQKLRGGLLIAIFMYPPWSLIYQWLDSSFNDPISHRLIDAFCSAIVMALSFNKKISLASKVFLYEAIYFIYTAHVFYLVVVNNVVPVYVLGAFCMLFCGAGLIREKTLLYFFGLFTLLSLGLSVIRQDQNSIILLAGVICAATMSLVSLKSLLYLIGRLKESYKAEEEKRRALDGMINALGQGFLSFGPSMLCHAEFSKACLDLLEGDPKDQLVWDVLKEDPKMTAAMSRFAEEAFSGESDFEKFSMLAPTQYAHSKNRIIELEFFPSYDNKGTLVEIVLVATDRTEQRRAEQELEKQRAYALMVGMIVKQRAHFSKFILEFKRGLEKYENSRPLILNDDTVTDYKRFLHTMKGASGIFQIQELVEALHQFEDQVSEYEFTSEVWQIQVQSLSEKLAQFLITNRDVIGNSVNEDQVVEIPRSKITAILRDKDFLNSPEAIQSRIYELGRVPLSTFFSPYSELVHHLAEEQGKVVAPMAIQGGEILVDPEKYSDLFSSFVHLFRNTVDHGFETAEERLANSKSAAGNLQVSFEKLNSMLRIVVKDDGRGVDVTKIRSKVKEPVEHLSDHQVMQLIFNPGLSTKEVATQLSGRGAGLDALKARVLELGGSIVVSSEFGKGATFTIEVPLMDSVVQFHPAA